MRRKKNLRRLQDISKGIQKSLIIQKGKTGTLIRNFKRERRTESGRFYVLMMWNNSDVQFGKMNTAEASDTSSRGESSGSGHGGGGGEGAGGRGTPMELDPYPPLGTKVVWKKGIIEKYICQQRLWVYERTYYRYSWFMCNIGNPGYRHYRE